jgi:hypothetical protein
MEGHGWLDLGFINHRLVNLDRVCIIKTISSDKSLPAITVETSSDEQ